MKRCDGDRDSLSFIYPNGTALDGLKSFLALYSIGQALSDLPMVSKFLGHRSISCVLRVLAYGYVSEFEAAGIVQPGLFAALGMFQSPAQSPSSCYSSAHTPCVRLWQKRGCG